MVVITFKFTVDNSAVVKITYVVTIYFPRHVRIRHGAERKYLRDLH